MLSEEANRMIEQMSGSARDIADKVQNVKGVGSDDDALVTVTCGPGNKIVNIEFDPRARRLDNHELAQKIIVAAGVAGDRAQSELMGLISEFSAAFNGGQQVDVASLKRTLAETQEKMREEQDKIRALYDAAK